MIQLKTIRHSLLILTFTLLAHTTIAQTSAYSKYVIRLKDKNNNPYSIYNPSAFLSDRSIERRNRLNIITDELDLPITPAYLDSIRNTGVTIQHYSKWLNAIVIETKDSLALQKILSFPFVVNNAPVGRTKKETTKPVITRSFINNNPDALLRRADDYGTALNQIAMVNGIGLHQKGFDGSGVLVAVFDGGFLQANSHPSMKHAYEDNRILAAKDFTGSSIPLYDDGSHGTQCLSIIGAQDPGRMIGTAPGASFILCRSEELSSEFVIEEYNWVAAAEFADSMGADIISSSLGYSLFDDSTMNHTYADMNGATCMSSIGAYIASTKGIIVCNSAGNQGASSWRYITAPSDADNILCVGAVFDTEEIAWFSSLGNSADGRQKPDVVAQGVQTTIANVYNGDYSASNGTSFSNPVIAGMVACLRQAHPDKSVKDIITAVVQSADRYSAPDTLYGYGIPDFQLADLLLSQVDLNRLESEKPVLFPNPFSHHFNIVIKSNTRQDVIKQIYDTTGRLLRSDSIYVAEGINQLVTETVQLPNGIYFIRIITDTQVFELPAIKAVR
ncbi:MAG: S8 family peptidase [Bacteroidota bacterium]